MLIWITTTSSSVLEGHPLPMPAKFGRRPFLRYLAHRTRQNDHKTSALFVDVINT